MKQLLLIVILLHSLDLFAKKTKSKKTTLAGSNYVALANSKGAQLFKQCSRSVPEFNAGSFYQVSEKEMRMVESKISAYVKQMSPNLRPMKDFKRQYLGFYMGANKKRLIYINAARVTDSAPNWKQTPIVACDGGANFWGVVYDPVEMHFSDLATNGHP